MDHEQDEDTEAPPFALSGTCVSRHLFRDETIAHFSPSVSPTKSMVLHKKSMFQPAMTTSPESSAPGLMASMVTNSTSSGSDSSLIHELASTTSQMGSSSAYLLSSLPSISSVTRADASQQILGSESMTEDHKESSRTTEQFHTSQRTQESLTFSQLMREIDVHEASLRASRMSVVPEEEVMEDFIPGGTLISSPNTSLSFDTTRRHQIAPRTQWLPNVFSPENTSGPNSMEDPLLDQGEYDSGPLVPTSPSDAQLELALSSVRAMIDTDDSFEVSMELPMGGTVESVMNILANPELLQMWCDPIQSLVVTSSSDSNTTDEGNTREYEAEWIEATTTALDPPSSSFKYIQTTGQAVLDAMGFPSYGKISMFIERRTGRVGLTLGPFSGGIHAAHHIRVSEVRGKLYVVDRVRLSRNAEEASSFSGIFTCGLLDSACLSPPLKSYMEQVSTSLARLRLLVESGEISEETEVVGGAH